MKWDEFDSRTNHPEDAPSNEDNSREDESAQTTSAASQATPPPSGPLVVRLSAPAALLPTETYAEGKSEKEKKKEKARLAAEALQDSRSIGRPPRLGFWPVLWRGTEQWAQKPTEVAQEARIAYVLIVLSFVVDWTAWFVLVFGLFKNFIANLIFDAGAQGRSLHTVIPAIICAVIGSLYPLAFAFYEINFYRSDLSRDHDSDDNGTPLKFFSDQRTTKTVRTALMILLPFALAIFTTIGMIVFQWQSAVEVSLWIILVILFTLAIYRFNWFIGFAFGVRALLIVLAAYVTSYPLEMMIYREIINEKHIERKRTALANTISLRIEALGTPPPRSFDIYEMSDYLNGSKFGKGSIYSRYSLCVSSQIQSILGRKTLREIGELESERVRLIGSLRCGSICKTKVQDTPGQKDLDRCVSELDTQYPKKGSGGLRAVCIPEKGRAEELRLSGVNNWIREREKELAEVEQKLGPVNLAKVAEVHTKCIDDPARPSSSLAHDIQVVDEWEQKLIPQVASESKVKAAATDKRQPMDLDPRYQPKLCSEAGQPERVEDFCIESPGLSEQILIMSDLQQSKENQRARAFAIFIALVLPILVILNKLLASEELHHSLSRPAEWSIDNSKQGVEALMAIVMSKSLPMPQRERALLRLLKLGRLDDNDRSLIYALREQELVGLLASFEMGRRRTEDS